MKIDSDRTAAATSAISELPHGWNQSNLLEKCESAKRNGAVCWKAKKVLAFFSIFWHFLARFLERRNELKNAKKC